MQTITTLIVSYSPPPLQQQSQLSPFNDKLEYKIMLEHGSCCILISMHRERDAATHIGKVWWFANMCTGCTHMLMNKNGIR